jgi:hypothetical protein
VLSEVVRGFALHCQPRSELAVAVDLATADRVGRRW